MSWTPKPWRFPTSLISSLHSEWASILLQLFLIVYEATPGGATNRFAYNGEDLRTQKVDSSGTQYYICDGASPASAVFKDGNTIYWQR